ncbi:hypothetical protein SO802_001792 [Lithocarpus litseifolius]|uniref:Uncharacterized protein n=1 Tax=Lithocarpus litseifolius TaxID=425828 RepID=A0AAW2DYX8_9ROSI
MRLFVIEVERQKNRNSDDDYQKKRVLLSDFSFLHFLCYNLRKTITLRTRLCNSTFGVLTMLSQAWLQDGMDPLDDGNDIGKLTESIFRVMPGKLEELIKGINRVEGDNITCVIADQSMGWALEVAEKLKLRQAAFWTAAAALLALGFIPKLIDSGIIDNDVTPIKNQMIQLAPNIPSISPTTLAWTCIGDLTTQKIIVDVILRNNCSVKLADWLICNSTYDVEPAAFKMSLEIMPEIIPIGPLLSSNRGQNSTGYFWQEDKSCLEWLDQQPQSSVIYVAFGSFTVFDQTQFQELALGLELSQRPFLLVVRPDVTEGADVAYPTGFLDC